MKKQYLFALLFSFILLFSMTACGGKQASASAPQQEPPKQTDTYWTAYEWDAGPWRTEEVATSLPQDEWWVDLILRTDGTAQLRDVNGDVFLQFEKDLMLNWVQKGNGHLELIDPFTNEMVWDGTIDGDRLTLNYMEGTLSLKRAEMPTEAGDLYCPAELKGTWMLVTDDTNGDSSPMLPGHFETLVIKEAWTADSAGFIADMEQKDYFGTYMVDSFYNQKVELLDYPVYDGCGNEVWSARIHRDESEDPRYSEYTFTLTDRDTLLMQKYSPWDERMTEYTYHRTLPLSSSWDIEAEHLDGLFLRCSEYTDADGNISSVPPDIDDFTIFLTADGVCQAGYQFEGSEEPMYINGTWQLGNGGTMLLISDPEYDSNFWYAGAIRADYGYMDDNYIEIYELYLYMNGGIAKLTPDAAG